MYVIRDTKWHLWTPASGILKKILWVAIPCSFCDCFHFKYQIIHNGTKPLLVKVDFEDGQDDVHLLVSISPCKFFNGHQVL